MKTGTEDFSIKVDGVQSVCPTGEAYAEENMVDKKIPVLACEDPCIRGDIARRAANMVAKEAGFARACYPEMAFVPHSAMTRWAKEADHVVMIDGCFLQCIGRVLNNLVEREKIIHVDALPFYNKWTEIFDMDAVPEAERIATARQVADQILPKLKGI